MGYDISTFETPCPNCGGKVRMLSFDSDCRGNAGSDTIRCAGKCKKEFTREEWGNRK